jgi:peptidylprolyl isomerase
MIWARISASTFLVAIALCATVVAGCGGGDSAGATADAGPQSLPLKSPPELEAGKGLPPKKLVVKDLWEGNGSEAHKGDQVKIQYYGVSWGSGLEHANSWRYEHIPVFTLGQRRLLRGLERGIRGMQEGGAREILIPYNLVYYPGGHHVHLSPLDALIYRVYLIKVLGGSHS